MIEETKVTRYRPVCEGCGWRGSQAPRKAYAEHELNHHHCGEHREQYDSTGGYRGILGGRNVRCVCGESWVERVPAKFKCPADESQA